MKLRPAKRPRPRPNPIVAPATAEVLVRTGREYGLSRSRVWEGGAINYGDGLLSKCRVWVERDNFYGNPSPKGDFLVIGFDTEFKAPSGPVSREVIESRSKYEVLSYQVYVKAYREGLPVDAEWGGVCYPEPGERLGLGAVIAFAIRGAIDAGVVEKAPSNIYLTGHFDRADIPAFADFKDMLEMADAIRGAFVTVTQSIPLDFDFGDGGPRAELNIHLRDTGLLTATQSKALAALGEVVGEPKVVLDRDPATEQRWKQNMDLLLREQPDLFERYALTDAKICARYMDQVLTLVRELTGKVTPPLTLTAIGVNLLLNSWKDTGLKPNDVLGMEEVEDPRFDKRRGYYVTERRSVPLDRVDFYTRLATEAYHGGRSEQFWFGPGFDDTWTDWDLSSAYGMETIPFTECPLPTHLGHSEGPVVETIGEQHPRPMGTKLAPHDASAYEALDRLLFREWDPIGVCAISGAEDEYRMYLGRFWTLVKSGAPAEEIAEYLGRVEADRITLTTSLEHRLDVARKAAALLAAWSMPVRP